MSHNDADNPVEPLEAAEPNPEAAREAEALIEQGIEAAQAGDPERAIELLTAAESKAVEAQDPQIAVVVRINLGFAHWMDNDLDGARHFFVEAAEIARQSEDAEHLKLALLNFAVASKQDGFFEDATYALEEYLALPQDSEEQTARVHLDCAMTSTELSLFDPAKAHIDEAVRIAEEAGLADVIVAGRIDEGLLLQRQSENVLAIGCFEDAVRAAREAGLDELAATAIMNQAHAHHRMGDLAEAEELFDEAQGLYRTLGMDAELADALYYQGVSRKAMGNRDMALTSWQEEEPIRRKLEQWRDLGDCLFEQAAVYRDRNETETLLVMYPKVVAAYEQSDAYAGLAETLLQHARLLRSLGQLEEALPLADRAADTAVLDDAARLECRVRGLRAMLRADLGDTDGAREDLTYAESLGLDNLLVEQVVWVMARLAYVFARQGEPIEEVILQLRVAYQHGVDNAAQEMAKRAVLRMTSEIKGVVDEQGAAALDALREELKSQAAQPAAEEEAPAGGGEDFSAALDSPFDAAPSLSVEAEPEADAS